MRRGGLKVLLPAMLSCPLPMPILPEPDRPRAMPGPLDSCLTGAGGAFRKGEGLGLPAGPAPGHAQMSALTPSLQSKYGQARHSCKKQREDCTVPAVLKLKSAQND